MKRNVAYPLRLFVAFAVVAVGFVASTLYTNARTFAIQEQTSSLMSNALPSIDHLGAAMDALRDLEVASDDYPDLPIDQQKAARDGIERRWHAVDIELGNYLKAPSFEGERELYEGGVPAALRALESALARLFIEMEAHNIADARRTADREVRQASNHAAGLLRQLAKLNGANAHDTVARIEAIRATTSRTALILDAASVLVGLLAALWAVRLHQAHTKLMQEHNAMVQGRADELELFGMRVAHDLLSPLSALTYCLSAFKRASEAEPKLHDALVRARSCVVRAQKMIDGIFEFSRAGGKPEIGAHADLEDVLEQAREEIRMADASTRPEVVIEAFTPRQVACSRGVLVSLLMNFLRNAAKYMSDSAVKQITIRVSDENSAVRIEVEDTGPGVPAGLEKAIFEPYVRAQGVTQPGLGLGLATVKRLCEAHGGTVGVRSTLGQGSVFWFTLPRASSAAIVPPNTGLRAVG